MTSDPGLADDPHLLPPSRLDNGRRATIDARTNAGTSRELTYLFRLQKGGAKPTSSSATYAPASSTRYESKPPPPRPLDHRDQRYNDAPNRLSPRPSPGHAPERYGMSPPPTASTGGRPGSANNQAASRPQPPPSPGPKDGGADPTLLPLFRAVDKDGEMPPFPLLAVTCD